MDPHHTWLFTSFDEDDWTAALPLIRWYAVDYLSFFLPNLNDAVASNKSPLVYRFPFLCRARLSVVLLRIAEDCYLLFASFEASLKSNKLASWNSLSQLEESKVIDNWLFRRAFSVLFRHVAPLYPIVVLHHSALPRVYLEDSILNPLPFVEEVVRTR